MCLLIKFVGTPLTVSRLLVPEYRFLPNCGCIILLYITSPTSNLFFRISSSFDVKGSLSESFCFFHLWGLSWQMANTSPRLLQYVLISMTKFRHRQWVCLMISVLTGWTIFVGQTSEFRHMPAVFGFDRSDIYIYIYEWEGECSTQLWLPAVVKWSVSWDFNLTVRDSSCHIRRSTCGPNPLRYLEFHLQLHRTVSHFVIFPNFIFKLYRTILWFTVGHHMITPVIFRSSNCGKCTWVYWGISVEFVEANWL